MATTEKEITRAQAEAPERPPEYREWQAPTPAVKQPLYGEQGDGDSEARYRRARERVEELRGFYTHAFMYVLVNLALAGINLITWAGTPWFLWVTFGWGVGLVSHAFVVFGVTGAMGKRWEDRKIRELMERDERR